MLACWDRRVQYRCGRYICIYVVCIENWDRFVLCWQKTWEDTWRELQPWQKLTSCPLGDESRKPDKYEANKGEQLCQEDREEEEEAEEEEDDENDNEETGQAAGEKEEEKVTWLQIVTESKLKLQWWR